MKKLFLFIILFFSSIFSNAQISCTFLGGIHNASLSPDYLTYADTTKKVLKKKMGIEFGLVINFEIKGGFSIRTGLLFSAKGSNWTQFYDTTNLVGRTINVLPGQKNILFSANTLLTTNYIDVPLNLFYSLPVNKKTKFIIGAGPMFSLILSCYTRFNTLSFSQDPAEEPEAHFEKQFIDLPVGKLPGRVRIFHLGYNAFVGVEFGRVSLIANYSKDISEFLEEQGKNYKHQIFGVTFGFNIEGIDSKNTN